MKITVPNVVYDYRPLDPNHHVYRNVMIRQNYVYPVTTENFWRKLRARILGEKFGRIIIRAAKVRCTALKSGCAFKRAFKRAFKSGCAFKLESQIGVLSNVLSNMLSNVLSNRGVWKSNRGAFKRAFKHAFKNRGALKEKRGPLIFSKTLMVQAFSSQNVLSKHAFKMCFQNVLSRCVFKTCFQDVDYWFLAKSHRQWPTKPLKILGFWPNIIDNDQPKSFKIVDFRWKSLMMVH